MSYKNKRLIKKVIEIISKNNFNNFINYFDDNVKWNIVGMPTIIGKKEFISAINSLELKDFTSSNIKNIICEGDFVVVESTIRENVKSNNIKAPAYCDIYRIKDSKICELTTYIIDTSTNIEKNNVEYNS